MTVVFVLSEVRQAPTHGPRVRVRHILIAFRGAQRSTQSRSKEEAEQLAAELYARLLAGEDMQALMKQYSNDSGGGDYKMDAGSGDMANGVYARGRMAGAFGDTGWRLEVDEIGVAPFDPVKSPFGWHIIQRVE